MWRSEEQLLKVYRGDVDTATLEAELCDPTEVTLDAPREVVYKTGGFGIVYTAVEAVKFDTTSTDMSFASYITLTSPNTTSAPSTPPSTPRTSPSTPSTPSTPPSTPRTSPSTPSTPKTPQTASISRMLGTDERRPDASPIPFFSRGRDCGWVSLNDTFTFEHTAN